MASIMLVDDCEDSREALKLYLESAGHTVRCVPDGREAIAEMVLQQPDAIVLDLVMPDLDGATFLDAVRSALGLQSLPVVVLTGLPDSPLANRARELKVSAILRKGSATLKDVRRAVEQAIEDSRSV